MSGCCMQLEEALTEGKVATSRPKILAQHAVNSPVQSPGKPTASPGRAAARRRSCDEPLPKLDLEAAEAQVSIPAEQGWLALAVQEC